MRKVTGNMDRHQVATLLENFNIGIAEHIALPNPYVAKEHQSIRADQLSKANVVSLANLPNTLDAVFLHPLPPLLHGVRLPVAQAEMGKFNLSLFSLSLSAWLIGST